VFAPSPDGTAPGRRPQRWGAPLAAVAAVAIAAWLLLALGWYAVRTGPRPAQVTPEAYGRVQEGMSRAEVQAAIGLPAGDYRDRAHQPGGRRYTEWSEEAVEEEFVTGETAGRLEWEGNGYSIAAGFDEAGVVQWKTLWKHVPPTPHGPLEQLLDWLDR
jgi:hypothetical protein